MSNVTDWGSVNVALALDVDFPSNVNQGPGIAIDKSAAIWTVSLGYPPLLENTHTVPSSNYYLAVYDVAGIMYEKVRLDNLIAAGTGLDTRTAIGDANYIATATDRYVGLNAPLTQNRIFSLPPAANVPGGRELVLQDEVGGLASTHYFNIQPTGSDTIDGAGQRVLATAYGGLRFRSNGSNAWNVIAVASVTPVANIGYACNSDDRTVVVTALTAPRTITLPPASSYPPGQRLTVADQSGQCGAVNTITVAPSGADLINGLAVNALAVINQAYGFLGLVSDGVSRWTIVDSASVTGSITSAQISDASPLGRQLLTQATAALDRTSLGSQATGDAMFLAATPAAGRAVLGSGATGDAVFTSATPAAAQSAMGLGTMATQNASAVNITGGTITGVSLTPGSLANVTITSGTINGTTIGQTTPAAGAFTTLSTSSTTTLSPANANVAISPTGSGTVTINPATPGHIDNTVIGATTPAAASLTSLNGGPLAGQRNKIINGDTRIDRWHVGAPVNALPAGSTYLVDRWAYTSTQAGKFNAGQNLAGGGAPSGFVNTLGLTVASAYTTAATDYGMLAQAIEGFNISDLQWGTAGALPVTLSFWVYCTVAGTHSGAIVNGAGTLAYAFTFSVPTASLWTKISLTILGPTTGSWASDNTSGMTVRFNLGSGANFLGAAGNWSAGNWIGATGAVNLAATSGAYIYVTGVQLEPGNVATPFERRLYGTEMALCQRYYWQDSFSNLAYNALAGTAIVSFIIKYPVTMRVAPTVTLATAATTAMVTPNMFTGWQSLATGGWANTGLSQFSAEL
jgi:hypothetical protein